MNARAQRPSATLPGMSRLAGLPVILAAFAALAGSFLVSYTRARAEGLGVEGTSGGLMGRPERLVLLGAGLFLGGVGDVLPVIMIVLAAVSLMTAGQRVWTVWSATRP